MMDIGIKVFDLLDQQIEECLEDDAAENALMQMYWGWWEELKKRVGTSSGFTGLSEYVFFRYILKSIERRTGTTFAVEENTKYTYRFRSQRFLLTHDIDIAKFVSGIHQRTDIAVLSASGNGDYRLIAVFELKVYVSDRNVMNDLFNRLGQIGQHTDSLLFPIFLSPNPQYDNETAQFCEKYRGRAFIISAFEHRYRIGIKQAVDKIMLQESSFGGT